MKKLIFFIFLLFIIGCGGSEPEVQANSDVQNISERTYTPCGTGVVIRIEYDNLLSHAGMVLVVIDLNRDKSNHGTWVVPSSPNMGFEKGDKVDVWLTHIHAHSPTSSNPMYVVGRHRKD